jgi:hypothetical protein
MRLRTKSDRVECKLLPWKRISRECSGNRPMPVHGRGRGFEPRRLRHRRFDEDRTFGEGGCDVSTYPEWHD